MMLKNLICLNTSKAVILPAQYLKYFEKIKGKMIKQVGIDINDEIITIKPIFKDINKEGGDADTTK